MLSLIPKHALTTKGRSLPRNSSSKGSGFKASNHGFQIDLAEPPHPKKKSEISEHWLRAGAYTFYWRFFPLGQGDSWAMVIPKAASGHIWALAKFPDTLTNDDMTWCTIKPTKIWSRRNWKIIQLNYKSPPVLVKFILCQWKNTFTHWNSGAALIASIKLDEQSVGEALGVHSILPISPSLGKHHSCSHP
jgi:hypothetical protein